MPTILIDSAANQPAMCWILGTYTTGGILSPPAYNLSEDKQHLAAMNLAFRTSGILNIQTFGATATSGIDFATLSAGTKVLIYY